MKRIKRTIKISFNSIFARDALSVTSAIYNRLDAAILRARRREALLRLVFALEAALAARLVALGIARVERLDRRVVALVADRAANAHATRLALLVKHHCTVAAALARARRRCQLNARALSAHRQTFAAVDARARVAAVEKALHTFVLARQAVTVASAWHHRRLGEALFALHAAARVAHLIVAARRHALAAALAANAQARRRAVRNVRRRVNLLAHVRFAARLAARAALAVAAALLLRLDSAAARVFAIDTNAL